MVEIKPGSLSFTIGTGGGNGTAEIVEYTCTATNTADAEYPAYPDIKVALTPPAAVANTEASIPWSGVIQTGSDTLKVPVGATSSTKFIVTVKASGAGAPATASGETTITGSAGADLALPTLLNVKIKATTAGTVTLTPSDIYIGTSTTNSLVKCSTTQANLKTYTMTVTAGNGTTPTPTPTPTPTTTTPKPTKTTTKFVTETPKDNNGKVTKTPKAGADTGGGGDMGPDGRMFILTGSLLILAAGAGGLMVRRRGLNRG
ncbi:hypothetical protein ACIBHY_41795 [Nonomuraea sp. NPDC050547]|uniref:hypothetical protein n=1 Tax=Nonomuraea sp. NPDC050547 TaxID=3364368 RepID=UPI003792A712